MFSSNSNNKNKTDISIDVGCTGATSGPCNLTFHSQSPNSPSKVKCANDANCTNTMNTYYYCTKHESHMCCNCATREQQKEKQEKQKASKYDDDNDVYMPEEGEIIEECDNGPNSHSTKTKNTENKKRKLSPLESADKYEPPHKKRKQNFDLEDYASLTGNDIIEMVNEKQDEIKQLNEKIRQQKRCTEKLGKQLKEKDEIFDELKQDKNKLAKQLNEHIQHYINDIGEKDDRIKDLQHELNAITAKNNRMEICNNELSASNADLNRYKIKSIQDISNLRDEIAAYEKRFETYKRVMKENDALKQDNENLRKQLIDKDKDLKTSEWKNTQFEKQRMDLKHARANWKNLEYMKAWNKFLDGNN